MKFNSSAPKNYEHAGRLEEMCFILSSMQETLPLVAFPKSNEQRIISEI